MLIGRICVLMFCSKDASIRNYTIEIYNICMIDQSTVNTTVLLVVNRDSNRSIVKYRIVKSDDAGLNSAANINSLKTGGAPC